MNGVAHQTPACLHRGFALLPTSRHPQVPITLVPAFLLQCTRINILPPVPPFLLQRPAG